MRTGADVLQDHFFLHDNEPSHSQLRRSRRMRIKTSRWHDGARRPPPITTKHELHSHSDEQMHMNNGPNVHGGAAVRSIAIASLAQPSQPAAADAYTATSAHPGHHCDEGYQSQCACWALQVTHRSRWYCDARTHITFRLAASFHAHCVRFNFNFHPQIASRSSW